jgi:GNAT superfamily N-acetyltransferase
MAAESSVTRTAHDALMAKASACRAGYRPRGVPKADVYTGLLLLDQPPGVSRRRRQTPLVHAGYALRFQAILATVTRFVDYVMALPNDGEDGSTSPPAPKAQLIFLGAGMDVTGLWAGHLADHLHIIEVDLPTVCATKGQRLCEEHQHVVAEATEKDGTIAAPSTIFRGTFRANQTCSYSLVAADLRATEALSAALDAIAVDWRRPALFVSEVVLAYIGQAASGDLLTWCARTVQHPHSCLCVLEPLGPVGNGSEVAPLSVLEGYQQTYTRMFAAKLERGSASTTSTTSGSSSNGSSLTPLGTSPRDAALRIRDAGWGHVAAVSLAKATAKTAMTAVEAFDEHAALLLHAQSYVVACAFSTTATALFRRVLAPWMSPIAPYRIPSTPSHFWITTMDATEEARVKDLFVEGYADLCRQSKSVSKLLQAALKKDLLLKPVDSDEQGLHARSHFAKYYEERRGCFLVAINATNGHIGGFIALSKASPKEKGILGESPDTFEVHRLFVVPEYRSYGLAGHLMDAIHVVARNQVKNGATATLVATTLHVLEAANRFYEHRGFTLYEKVPLQDVTLHTYYGRFPKEAAV